MVVLDLTPQTNNRQRRNESKLSHAELSAQLLKTPETESARPEYFFAPFKATFLIVCGCRLLLFALRIRKKSRKSSRVIFPRAAKTIIRGVGTKRGIGHYLGHGEGHGEGHGLPYGLAVVRFLKHEHDIGKIQTRVLAKNSVPQIGVSGVC